MWGLAFNIWPSCEIDLLQIRKDRWKYLELLHLAQGERWWDRLDRGGALL